MKTAMVHRLYQLEKIPQKSVMYHTKNDLKTQHYNSVESSELKSGAWMSMRKMSVDGQYCSGS